MKYAIAALFSLTLWVTAQTPKAPTGLPVPAPRKAVKQNPPAQVAGKKFDPNALAVAEGVTIDGSNWDDLDVADAYTSYTGKRVLLSSATQKLEIRFVQRGPLTNAEAARLLDKVLNMEGYAFVPSGANEVKLLPKAQGTGASAPADTEMMFDDTMELPQGDEYISYVMNLSYIKPEEAVRTFTQSINGLDAGTKLAAVPNASAVIITGKAGFVRKLIKQKEYIDVAAGSVDSLWVKMKHADAEEVAATLNQIMSSQKQSKTTAGVTTGGAAPKTPQTPIPGGARGNTNANAAAKTATTGGAAAGEDIPIQIVADTRLNKILLMGRPTDIVFVEGLARGFDAPSDGGGYQTHRLKFMRAADFLEVASNALESVGGAVGGSQQAGSGGGRQTSGQSQGGGGQTGGQTTNSAAVGESIQEFDVSTAPESRVIGKTLLVADNEANSILVKGPPESMRIVSDLIQRLDGRPQQVMISTVFGQVSIGKDKDIGVSLGGVANGDGTGDGVAGNSDSGLVVGNLFGLDGLTDIAGVNAASATGLNIYGQVKDITGVIRALESRSDFKVFSRPTVYTSNNKKAIISSGRRIAVPTNTFTSGATTGATQSTNIEYRDVLLRFEVVPLINSDDEVTLRISLVNEDTQGVQIIDGNEIPTIVTESIVTTVTVSNGATVVLGGLVTETETSTRIGVPVLSSIPALGRLFRRDVKGTDRRELLIFIQPTIINGDISQRAAQTDMERRYTGASAARDFASGVLPSKPEARSKTSTPTKKAATSKAKVPTASKRPKLRYPTRR